MGKQRYKKGPGVLRAGFEYQDLVALETLIDFYRDKDLYEWVQLDAEDSSFQSIEDVVACRPDGLYDLTQVKFTADPERPANYLSWKWLTDTNRGRRKSLLQKWAKTTLNHKHAGTLARAVLKTDRVPDDEFLKSLEGTRVNYYLLSAACRRDVERQIGSPEAANAFFDSFDFCHSQRRIDDLEEHLWSRISSDTDLGGWSVFRRHVQRWSTLRDQPAPDGRIQHTHLRRAFSVGASKPIPQDFRVPKGYIVSDDSFDRSFLERVVSVDGTVVLWGPPGRGKSTYLSHCVERIDRRSSVCVRHHYFLSLSERSERFQYTAIYQSLRHQIVEAVPSLRDSRGDLAELVEEAATNLRQESRRLIIVIDGLDHVWREHRDHEDMEALFSAMLPLPKNVTLVVGTQKVAEEHLPAKLLRALPTEQWTELPLMSVHAVERWLQFQDDGGRLHLRVGARETRNQLLQGIARALYDISHGLPLHLIYSFEAIAQNSREVTASDVLSLPACPSGDIRDYYRSIWKRIRPKAQAILHVLAGLSFGPPPFAANDCFGRDNDSLMAFAEIEHLLYCSETEILPFHESLFAYARELPEHKTVFSTHASSVLGWLEHKAPEYWRWGWAWVTKARLGREADLLDGPSREWVVTSLVAGYPIDQVVNILDHAERAALAAFDLPRLLVLRLLKTRAKNGPEFQTDDWWLFPELGVMLSSESWVEAILRMELHRLPARLLPFVVRNSDESIRSSVACEAISELNRRIVRRQQDRATSDDDWSALLYSVAGVAAGNVEMTPDWILQYAKRTTEPDVLILQYAKESLIAGNFENVISIGKEWSRFDLDREVLTALCLEGLCPSLIPGLKAKSHPAIQCFAVLKGADTACLSNGNTDVSDLFNADYGSPMARQISGVLYEAFFNAVAGALCNDSAVSLAKVPVEHEDTWLSLAVGAFDRLVSHVVKEWKEYGRWPSLSDVFGAFRLERPAFPSNQERSQFLGVRLALCDIAVDICKIARGIDASAMIDEKEIERAAASPFWLDELWLDAFGERTLPLHTPLGAKAFADRVARSLDSEITDYSERTSISIRLALFAYDNDLPTFAEREFRRAIGCLLGYGYHKDLFALEVLESLNVLAIEGDREALDRLLRLAGAFESITEYTDGDETDYIRKEYYKTVVEHFPERASMCYARLIRNQEWNYAEVLGASFAESSRSESTAGQALLETYILPNETLALETTEDAERPRLTAALRSVSRKTGTAMKVGTDEGDSQENKDVGGKSNAHHPVGRPSDSFNVVEFPPGKLARLLHLTDKEMRYAERRDKVGEWLRYWSCCGLSNEALIDFDAAVTANWRDLDVYSNLDLAFEIALKSQGRSRAFRWLVRAHSAKSGWQRRIASTDEETSSRIQAVAQHYRGRWKEYVVMTTKARFGTQIEANGIVVGLSYMVRYLVEVGQASLARAYALEMARIFEQELQEQPIQLPDWSR